MLKRISHKTALLLENTIDRIFGRTGKGRFIDPYIGYTTPGHIVLRGRVLSKLRHATAQENQSRFSNFRQILGMFLTDEVKGATVLSGTIQTTSDEEGYFTLHIPNDNRTGWSTEPVAVTGNATPVKCPVLAPGNDARFMVISDVDDTMLKTGAYSLLKNLYTSFSGNYTTRRVFPDAIMLMNDLSEQGRNPVYYVSSSPWNMHDFLADIFNHANLVRGPMFLRDLGLSKTKFITEGHGSHKGKSIDTILAANSNLPAILLGDTGQHDAEIYHEAIKRHPGRIAFVGLRTPGKGLDDHDEKDLHALSSTKVPYAAEQNFSSFLLKIQQQCPNLFKTPNT